MMGRSIRFSKFALVGMLGAFVQLTLFWFFNRYCRVHVLSATVLAVEMTVLHNFLWHQRFTWSDRTSKTSREIAIRILRFHSGNGLISLVGNAVLTYSLVVRFRLPAVPANIIAISCCSLANFLLADLWVYN